jgi:hypothetical protein
LNQRNSVSEMRQRLVLGLNTSVRIRRVKPNPLHRRYSRYFRGLYYRVFFIEAKFYADMPECRKAAWDIDRRDFYRREKTEGK